MSDFLLGVAAAALLACLACAVFPWALQLAFREMPGALLAAVSGRSARRRLVRLLKDRHAASREVMASLPQGEPYAVFAVRYIAARLPASPFGPPGGRYRGQPVPAPVMAVLLEQARRANAGREALRARAEHERYERGFATRGPEVHFRTACSSLSGAGALYCIEEWPEIRDARGDSHG
jgi:hypothetical protein